MAETCKCFLLILALITCFQMLFTEGRPIKSTNKQELVSIEKETLEDVGKQGVNTNLHHNTAKNKKLSLPSPPITHNPSVHHSQAGRKELSSDTAAVSKDYLRPTTPGVSPGVGHPKTIGTNSNNEHSLKDFKHDFHPTAPGHSPGVGHALLDDDDNDVYPRAPGTGSSIERSGTAFKPKTPGDSPGVGHLLSENNIEDVDPKAPGTSSSSGQSVTTFKQPRPAGNSPGIGHMLSEDKIEIIAPAASSIEHSVTGVTDDFRLTVPGHSPGVGHVFQNTNEERKA